MAVLVALVVASCGCSTDGGEGEGRDTAGVRPPAAGSAFPGAGVDCPAEDPHPVTAELATGALVRSGFAVEFDPSACGHGVIAGMLGNGASSPNVLEDEGLVICFLLSRPRPGRMPGEIQGETGAAHAERTIANLTCDLYAARRPVDDEAARLDRAFERLRARIR